MYTLGNHTIVCILHRVLNSFNPWNKFLKKKKKTKKKKNQEKTELFPHLNLIELLCHVRYYIASNTHASPLDTFHSHTGGIEQGQLKIWLIISKVIRKKECFLKKRLKQFHWKKSTGKKKLVCFYNMLRIFSNLWWGMRIPIYSASQSPLH